MPPVTGSSGGFDLGQAGQGALGGAAAGSALGPVGAVGGALLGGLFGGFGSSSGPSREEFLLPGFEDRQAGLQGAVGQAEGLGAPSMQAAQIGQFGRAGLGGPFRSGQSQLIGQLQQQAAGLGPSLATQQFERSLGSGIAAQQAQASTGRGNQALGARAAAQNIGGLTQDLAGQAAQARMQEQMQARAQLGGVLGQARGQEIQADQFNVAQQNQRLLQQAQLAQQAGQLNLAAELRNRAQQNAQSLGLRQLELENAMAQQRGQQGFAGTQKETNLGTQILSGGGQMLANRFLGGGSPGGQGGSSFGPMQLQTGSDFGIPGSLGGQSAGFGANTLPGQGSLGAVAPVDLSGSGVTGAQAGYQLPRL